MAKKVVEVPEELEGVVEPLEELLREVQEQVARGRLGGPVDYEPFERIVRAKLGGLERAVHERTLAALDVDAPRVRINGVEHTRVGRHQTTFMTQAGEVKVTRTLYRPAGQRNAPAVDPVALRAGALEGVWLPGTARAMAFLLQQGPSREAKATAEELGTLPFARTSFEHVGHAVGAQFIERRDAIERVLIEAFELPEGAASVSVSLDRVSIPMEEPRPRPAGRPKKNAPKKPVARVFRMAYCGTVTLHDEEGQALHTLRYGTMPAGDVAALVTAMADDVLVLRSQRPALKLALLCDGAPEMWNLLSAEFDEELPHARLLDFYHLLEKLVPAAEVVFGTDAAHHMQRYKLALLNRSSAAATIRAELEASGQRNVRRGDARPVHEAITYLTNNAERTDYAAARRAGLPIASGNVEATCKSLVSIRMKRSGSRWKHETGEHVLQLRALALSDRWGDAMDLMLRVPRVLIRPAA